jgi:heterodisulfide reductase subunit A
MHEPEMATRKAKDLVRIAVAKARMLEPLVKGTLKVNNDALVIGGGIAGMTAALNLADQGFKVHLVENQERLGGNLVHIHSLLSGDDPQQKLKSSIEKVNAHPNIDVYLKSIVSAAEGSVGNIKSTIQSNGDGKQVSHGVVIVATGAEQYEPTEYLYGKNPRVLTQRTFEQWLSEDKAELKNVKSIVMIQCVGSRDEIRPYCSRICCSEAVKNAIVIKNKHPETDVYILYRDVRTYGLLEEHYRKAREKGVRFIRYEEDKKPEVSANNGSFKVSCVDPVLNTPVTIDSDLVVLAPAIVPGQTLSEVGKLYK